MFIRLAPSTKRYKGLKTYTVATLRFVAGKVYEIDRPELISYLRGIRMDSEDQESPLAFLITDEHPGDVTATPGDTNPNARSEKHPVLVEADKVADTPVHSADEDTQDAPSGESGVPGAPPPKAPKAGGKK